MLALARRISTATTSSPAYPATGGASALRLPTSLAQSEAADCQTRIVGLNLEEMSQRKKHTFWCAFSLAPLVGLEPTTVAIKAQFAIKDLEVDRYRLLRCPEFLCLVPEIPTAATSSPRFSRHRRRFGSSPTDFA